jgi:hypothetical protein
MMLLIEYINVITRGKWQNKLRSSRFSQYFLGVFMGALPGCLGSFTIVSLYSHNIVSFGTVVGAMIATSGDEAYVMLSMFPDTALILTLILFVIGLITGVVVDKLVKNQKQLLPVEVHGFEVHSHENFEVFSIKKVIIQFKNISFERTLLLLTLFTFVIMVLAGEMAEEEESWIRLTFLLSIFAAIFVITTVPQHFLEEHLWKHLLKKHLLKIFLWILGTLILIHILEEFIAIELWIQDNYLYVLLVAVLVGLIPESGPHLIFVTLFANGSIPFSILMASSIVQDGHGTIPLLASSKKGFIYLKLINGIVGLIFGLIILGAGY